MEEKYHAAVMGTHQWPALSEEPLIGKLTLARTKFFNTLYVYHCVRAPGYVLEFSCRKGTLFHCCGCKRNGKTRCITVINSVIVPGVKHPEDDHHPRCHPLELSESAARQIDRDIRHEVLTTGKRPRDAFTDMITSLPKKFKSPELHKKVISKIPSFNKVQPQLARLRAEGYASRLYMADPFGILAAIGGLEEIEKYSRRNAATFCAGERGAMSDGEAPSTSQSPLDAGAPSGPECCCSSSVPVPSIRDVTSVDVDQLDCDSIDQLQLVLRRLQRRCHDDDDVTDDDDAGDDERHDDVTAHEMMPGDDQHQQQTSAADDVTAVDRDTVDDGLCKDERSCSTAAAVDCPTSSQQTSSETSLSSEPSTSQQPAANTEQPASAAEIKQDHPESGSENGDCRPQDRLGLSVSCNELTLILRLQRDLATMQLQLSNLQDAMRTANATLQLLLQRAFNGYN